MSEAATAVTIDQSGALLATHSDNGVEVWDIRSKHKLFSYKPKAAGLYPQELPADFCGDGKSVAIGDTDGAIHILEARTGKQQSVLLGHANIGGIPTFDKTGARLYGGSKTVWDLKSGSGLRTVPGKVGVLSQVSQNGAIFAEDAGTGTVRIWDLTLQKQIANIKNPDDVLTALTLSPNGSLVALVKREDEDKPEVKQRKLAQRTGPMSDYVNALRKGKAHPLPNIYASDDPQLRVELYDSHTGVLRFPLSGSTSALNAVAFSPDGSRIAAASSSEVKVWTTTEGKLLSSTSLGSDPAGAMMATGQWNMSNINSLAFSPDGTTVAAGMYAFSLAFSGMMQPAMFPPQPGRTPRSFGGFGVPSIRRKRPQSAVTAALPTNNVPTSLSFSGPVMLCNTATSKVTATLKGHSSGSSSVAFSDDGKLVASSGMDGFIRIWQTASGSLKTEIPTTTTAYFLAFRPGGHVLASSQVDGTIALWEVDSGQRLATLVSLYDGADWLVITPDGLFDGSPAAWNQILWRYSRNTFDVASVESFFSEYFYPGLLAEIMAGKHPKPPSQITSKDRRQPAVNIALQGDRETSLREVTVTVEVTEIPAGDGHPRGSGAKDLRLFRNGSLVKVWRGDLLAGHPSAKFTATVPIVAGKNRLMAYSFNTENVKSRDAEATVVGAPGLYRRPATYVLAVGVDEYENPDYNLKFAVSDAQSLTDALQREQAKAGNFEVIPLYNHSATRAAILEAIAKLASKTQPEDHVILFFASHGTADHDRFYLIPSDLGFKGKRTELDEAGVQEILKHTISDRDLEQALANLDADQVVVVIDACNSGQALEAEEKRRGPMNSRGLAQLAYEKGMYILTAAQSYQAALEVSQLGHGLLTYSLISEGLLQKKADDDPQDGTILVREWLSYATRRVPELQLETLQNAKAVGRSISFEQNSPDPATQSSIAQRPKLFYRRELSSSPWVISGTALASGDGSRPN